MKYNRNGEINCQGIWENGQLVEYKLNDQEINEGYITLILAPGIFVGNLNENSIGSGILWNSKGNKQYEGLWKNNKFHGYGKEYYGNFYHKIKYVGNFIDHLRTGYGISYFDNGKVEFVGYWNNDNKSEFGKIYTKCGVVSYQDHNNNDVLSFNSLSD